jgi:hypothetical protein
MEAQRPTYPVTSLATECVFYSGAQSKETNCFKMKHTGNFFFRFEQVCCYYDELKLKHTKKIDLLYTPFDLYFHFAENTAIGIQLVSMSRRIRLYTSTLSYDFIVYYLYCRRMHPVTHVT